MAKGTSINDAIHGLIHMTAFEKIIISTPGFNRLHDVYQNSTLYLTFPCNRTKRFEHSIGTMKLCSDMFYYSVLNAEPDELKKFYGCALEHIKEILDVINSRESKFDCDIYFAGKYDFRMEDLNSLELDEQRRAFIPYGIPDEYKIVQVILMEAILTAALLHDIGHPPFSHIIEHALKEAYEEVMLKKTSSAGDLTGREKDFLEALEPCFMGGDAKRERKLHEQYAA